MHLHYKTNCLTVFTVYSENNMGHIKTVCVCVGGGGAQIGVFVRTECMERVVSTEL
jgi:hypothetical protein